MSANSQNGSRPTVVLVHGAFADASGWNGVIERLQAKGVQVTAPAIPLRGLSIDSAYINSLLDQIPGPVLAVGHSYGGAVITNATTNTNNVLGLVYVSAFAPDEGETLGAIASDSKDSVLSTARCHSSIRPERATRRRWSLPSILRSSMSLRRRPARRADRRDGRHPAPRSRVGVLRANGEPAWKKVPSWAVVASGDKAAGADVVRSMAERAGATITEVEGSHVIMISKPQIVAEVILTAVAAVG